MSGLTGLIDTLLAARLAPQLDVAAIKAEAASDAPGHVVQVLEVDNDVRLPSNAALDRQIPAGPPATPHLAVAATAPLPAIELSVAARIISDVLADLHAEARPVRGATPAWPSLQAPSTPALADALAQTVSGSGLFYESHLLQFAGGTRTLAQLTQEPQAHWSMPAAAPAGHFDTLSDAAPMHPADDTARHVAGASAVAGAPSGPPAVVAIHPQAVTLVHQQLDLLATAVFRWSGQAWPGVPMDWSIQEESEEHHADTPDQDGPRRWSTTVSLALPRLGAMDLRLGLTGSSVQACLAASESTTRARLHVNGGELALRFEATGLRLQELQVTAMARP